MRRVLPSRRAVVLLGPRPSMPRRCPTRKSLRVPDGFSRLFEQQGPNVQECSRNGDASVHPLLKAGADQQWLHECFARTPSLDAGSSIDESDESNNTTGPYFTSPASHGVPQSGMSCLEQDPCPGHHANGSFATPQQGPQPHPLLTRPTPRHTSPFPCLDVLPPTLLPSRLARFLNYHQGISEPVGLTTRFLPLTEYESVPHPLEAESAYVSDECGSNVPVVSVVATLKYSLTAAFPSLDSSAYAAYGSPEASISRINISTAAGSSKSGSAAYAPPAKTTKAANVRKLTPMYRISLFILYSFLLLSTALPTTRSGDSGLRQLPVRPTHVPLEVPLDMGIAKVEAPREAVAIPSY